MDLYQKIIKNKKISEGRIFKEVNAGHFVAQKRKDRYTTELAPRSAIWRSNLVALSQRHNLYFVAHGDELHITIPRNLQQKMPGASDLILEPPRTNTAVRLGGYINDARPHDINQIRVGNLGRLEIILIATDDGDVIAYYTHTLRDEIKLRGPPEEKPPKGLTKPFFHENVGASAWGLAIHEKSRLIAVSSNLREVTIFAPGLYIHLDEDIVLDNDDYGGVLDVEKAAASSTTNFPVRQVGFLDLNKPQILRPSNCKIVIPLGPQGHNIPSIDFSSDTEGNAALVLATDINGNLWTLSLSTSQKARIPRMQEEGNNNMGWGVVCIPLDYFKVVLTPQEAFGMAHLNKLFDNGEAQVPPYFNITESVKEHPDNASVHPVLRPQTPDVESPLQLEPDTSNASDTASTQTRLNVIISFLNDNEFSFLAVKPPRILSLSLHNINWLLAMEDLMDNPSFLENPLLEEWLLEMEVRLEISLRCDSKMGSSIEAMREKLERHALHKLDTWPEEIRRDILEGKLPTFEKISNIPDADHDLILPDGSAVLRIYTHDIELIPPRPGVMCRTMCVDILKQYLPAGLQAGRLEQFDRMNMFAVIPELSLVVIANQLGRAALLTLTRLEEGFSWGGPVTGMRLDCILPLDKDDGNRKLCPLLGMAVAPLQGRERSRDRWRILLHFYNEDILSYEVWRDEGNGLEVI